jgi:hypothetical protein
MEDELNRTKAMLQESIAFNQHSIQVMQQLAPHIERYGAMENLLLDADRLAAYTVDYFTHVQPLPERPNAAASLVRPEFPSMPASSGNDGTMRLANVRPDQRWIVADQMEQQGLLRGKPIVVQ